MNKAESKYYNTAVKMDEALLELLKKKDFEYITVKEICKKAGINRSTFYLHYETINDILTECVEYINQKCFDRYSDEQEKIKDCLAEADLKDLIFISPEYLQPYLEFVKENKQLFKTAISRPSALNAESTFSSLFAKIFSPILDRFHYPDTDKHYVISFYISGLIAIVSDWIKLDCKDSIQHIIDLCMKCIMPHGKEAHLSYFQNIGGGAKN